METLALAGTRLTSFGQDIEDGGAALTGAAGVGIGMQLIMSPAFAAALAVFVAPAAAPYEPFPQTNGALTWHRRESTMDPAWFVCDGIDRPVVHVVGALDARAGVTVWNYAKHGFATSRTAYTLGNSDAGAGSIGFPLHAYPRGRVHVGSFRALNAGALLDPESATTGIFSAVTQGRQTTRCRWLPGTRLALITARRSVFVTRERGELVYRSFDFDARPRPTADGRSTAASLTLRGGVVARGLEGPETDHDVYVFRNGRYAYRVRVSRDSAEPGAGLSIVRDGRTIQSATAAAYTVVAGAPRP